MRIDVQKSKQNVTKSVSAENLQWIQAKSCK